MRTEDYLHEISHIEEINLSENERSNVIKKMKIFPCMGNFTQLFSLFLASLFQISIFPVIIKEEIFLAKMKISSRTTDRVRKLWYDRKGMG